MILLDTHVLIWWVEGGGRLSPPVAAALADPPAALVSPISFWELAMLAARGRVAIDREPVAWVRDLLAGTEVEVATLTPWAAMAAAVLVDFHGDPADRLIYSTARELGVPLASKDRRLRDYALRHGDVRVLW